MDALERIAEWILGIPPAVPGQGTQWRYGHNFPWPAWLLLLFCAAAAAGVWWIYRRDAARLSSPKRALLAGLRLSAITVLLFMLSESVLMVERTGLPSVAVLLDVSGSMNREDVLNSSAASAENARPSRLPDLRAAEIDGPPSRLNAAKTLLVREQGRFLKELMAHHTLRLFTMADVETSLGAGEQTQSAEIDALLPHIRALQSQGIQSRLGDALRRVLNSLRGTPPAALVVLSDGCTTDGEKLSAAARYARQKGVPIYAVVLGNTEPVRDVALHDVLADDVAFVDDPVTWSLKLTGSGYANRSVRVQLRKKDSPQILSRKEVPLPPDGESLKAELTFTPDQVGEFDYLIEAVPLPGETNLKNNLEERHVSVRKEKIRVLLADGIPRWEFRELKVLLEREKTIELKTVLQDADAEYTREDRSALPNFPVRKEELFQYDVIILGDINLSFLSTTVQEHLRQFVSERGGGLLFIAGPDHNPLQFAGTPLEPVLPIVPASVRLPNPAVALTEEFHPELTLDGRKGTAIFRFADNEADSLAAWDNLPGLYWYAAASELRPAALALVTHPTQQGSRGKIPIIALQRFGAGKVLFQATDETWRWRYRAGDAYYGRYWVQAIRYLSRSRMLGRDNRAVLTTDREKYEVGETVEFRVRFLDERLVPSGEAPVIVVIERAGSAQQKLHLHRLPEASTLFEGRVTLLGEGTYHAWVATPAFASAPPSDDFQVEATQREYRITQADRGELSQAASVSQGKLYTLAEANQLPGDIPPGIPVPLESGEPLRLWNHWLALMLFAGLLTAEWVLRKRFRLV